MMNFYRKFLPNMATIAMLLVDCIRKGQPNKVIWGDPQEFSPFFIEGLDYFG